MMQQMGTIGNRARNVEIFSGLMLWITVEGFSFQVLESKTYNQIVAMPHVITHLSLKWCPV